MQYNTLNYKFKVCLCISWLAFLPPLTAGKNYEEPIRRKIYLTPPGKKIEGTIILKTKIKPNSKSLYYWFDQAKIHTTQGAYSGYLLDGDYIEFSYPENNILLKGNFKRGLKHGMWIGWYSNGIIKSMNRWSNGSLNGTQKDFDSTGQLLSVQNFNHGKFIVPDSTGSLFSKAGYVVKRGIKKVSSFFKKQK